MSNQTGSSPPDKSGGNISDFGGDGSRVVLLKIGELSSDVKTLMKAVDKLTTETETLKTKAAKVETAVKVTAACLAIGFAIFMHLFGSHVNAVVENAVREVTLSAANQSADDNATAQQTD